MLLRRAYFDPVVQFQRLHRQMNDLFTGDNGRVHEFPPVNVWTSENDVRVTAELPGINPEEIEISVLGNTLTLKGQRKAEDLKEGESYLRRERVQGTFSRSLELPFRVDAANVQANFNKGVLTVALARAEEDKPKKISVKVS